MDQPTVRKTFKYQLRPAAEQAGTMAFVVRRCRELYNAALEERREAWRLCKVSITMAGQSAQRRVSRRVTGSHRCRKAVKLLAKAHQTVRRARQDFHHKTALALVRQYDTIYHEALQPANMVRNHHLAKSIADGGWGAFLSILSFKAAYAGKMVVAVPAAYTSQACSGCGVLVHKGLSVRWHACPDCGTSLHRDHNAALNILKRGQELQVGPGMAPQALTQPVGAHVA